MRSLRVPHATEPNAWALRIAARRAVGGPLLDLTDADPTHVGLGGATPEVLAALADPRGVTHRPESRGLPEARAAVADYYGARGHAVTPDDLVLVASTSEAYAHLMRVLCDPGDRVIAPAPSYPLLGPLAAAEGVALDTYRLRWDGRWHVDFATLERAIGGRTRAVVVVQPNHPTGTCLDAAEVATLETLCARHGLAIVSDEVFGDHPWDPARPLPSLLGERAVPTFVLGGLSKTCGMPQLKLSWIACAGPSDTVRPVLEGLTWIADLFLSVATPVQLALPVLLEQRHAFRARVHERIATNLGRLRAACARRPELGVLDAEGGWVAVLRVPDRWSDDDWAVALADRGVVVHPGHFYDLEDGSHLVVSLIVEPATFAAGADALEALSGEG